MPRFASTNSSWRGPAVLPGAEAVAVEDRAAVHDEAAARERDEVLDEAVRADRGDRRLDVVDADAVPGEPPLLGVLGPRLVLGRARDQ
jgi:hypothetical protein